MSAESDIDTQARDRTVRRYGREPDDALRVAVFTFVAVGAGVPVCVIVADLLGLLFGYRLVAGDVDVFAIFMSMGLAAGVGAFFVTKWRRDKWFTYYTEEYMRLRGSDK